jgi:GxxExxY protein
VHHIAIWDNPCIVSRMQDPSIERSRLNGLSNQIIGAALRVHEELGPGLLESASEACLAFEIVELGLTVERQKPLPLIYRGRRVDCGYRIDMLVDDALVVEVKAIEQLARVHAAQLRSHLRLSNLKLGLLINFNVHRLRDGIKRVVNGFPE